MADTLIVVVGPTGTGKTSLSLELAEALGSERTEIVNADAMQLYRGMDIGTAKLPVGERRNIPHHLFDVLEVTEESTAAAYQPLARTTIERIQSAQRAAVLVGGSGLYVSAALFAFQFPGTDPKLRAELEAEVERDGIAALFARLASLNPEAAARIDGNNPRRVIRALEVLQLTGTPAAGMLPEQPMLWQPATIVGLFEDRDRLTARLDERVEDMWRNNFLDEVEQLRIQGLERGVTARRAIGYAQALQQLKGMLSEREAIEETQALTRRYARRQMSWFKRYPKIRWFAAGQENLAARVLDADDPGDALAP